VTLAALGLPSRPRPRDDRGVKLLAAVLLAFAAGACVSHAGPFITNIAYAPDGRLVVDKCYVEYDNGSREVSNSDCTREVIAPPRVVQPVMAAPSALPPAATPPAR
jgi:hypothetical protein